MDNGFAKWIREQYLKWRDERGGFATMGDFAKELGVSNSALTLWMQGRRGADQMRPQTIRKLAKALGPDVYAVLNLRHSDEQTNRFMELYDLSNAEIVDEVETYWESLLDKSDRGPHAAASGKGKEHRT